VAGCSSGQPLVEKGLQADARCTIPPAVIKEVAICIATCQRPRGLHRLLEGLARLEFRGPLPSLRFIVVDNAPSTSGLEVSAVVEEMQGRLPGPIELLEEPRRGISFARNTLLDATASTDWIAFIDDDEVPEPVWLSELLDVQEKTGAEVVTGPVLRNFTEPPPAWAEKGSFFEAERYATGAPLWVAYTGNVLFHRGSVSIRFDEQYALSGGSDSHFFRRLHRSGCRIVWADDAIVHEWVPASRVRVAWIMKRSFRVGNGIARIALEANPGIATSSKALGGALLRFLRGGVQLVLSSFGPAHRRVRALDTIASGAGRLAALFGIRGNEYRRVHGS